VEKVKVEDTPKCEKSFQCVLHSSTEWASVTSESLPQSTGTDTDREKRLMVKYTFL